MTILITGVSGFIGFHVANFLLKQGNIVIGIDNLNDYYDVQLKISRLKILESYDNFNFHKLDISHTDQVLALAKQCNQTTSIIHLAAQAGVRYSLENPFSYVSSNIQGLVNILELSRSLPYLKHMIFASSSSVYGNSDNMPFKVGADITRPISLYAATKCSGELMCYSYSHLYKIPTTILRFFTVYGPWGRPDMATYIFTKAIINNTPIKLFNKGQMRRDFTYIDDIVLGIMGCIHNPPFAQDSPYKIYNLGNNKSVMLKDFVRVLEESLHKKAIIIEEDMQAGDVQDTYADITEAKQDFNFLPQTSTEEGIPKFVDWFKSYYNV